MERASLWVEAFGVQRFRIKLEPPLPQLIAVTAHPDAFSLASPTPESITSLREALSEVAAIQPLYTSFTTPEMQIRGRLVRRTIP